MTKYKNLTAAIEKEFGAIGVVYSYSDKLLSNYCAFAFLNGEAVLYGRCVIPDEFTDSGDEVADIIAGLKKEQHAMG